MKPGGSDSSLDAQIEAWEVGSGGTAKSLTLQGVISLRGRRGLYCHTGRSGLFQQTVAPGLDSPAELGVFG